MLTSKLYFEFGLFLLGCFYFENQIPLDNVISKNSYTTVAKDKIVTQSQTPGKEIYLDFCIQCHGANGKGDSKNFPVLDGSDWLINKRAQSIHAVKFGQSGQIIVNKMKFNNSMPPMGLSNQEVADVMNYIMNSWSNKQSKLVTEKEVAGIKN
ncbi:c-type cytochrome [Flavobacterium sp. ZS1P14]|uniref:c-type cytochrome n=1 Tax=Flavobacterium sp. ZS1P14 TaxID=3401729 RepID=UPI003AAC1E8D